MLSSGPDLTSPVRPGRREP